MRSGQVEKRNGIRCIHFAAPYTAATVRNCRAGFPATIELAGTSRVTTLPAPTIAFSPTVTLERIVAPDAIDAPFLTKVLSTCQSASVCNCPSVAALG